ncbi:MAG: NADH-quinone oxidoreductase subunit L [Candidatus Omnitrophica bacterium]|nr:NADH-quinone oxidoreductase subunit L [Candidatus Omnitrophota bacterium]
MVAAWVLLFAPALAFLGIVGVGLRSRRISAGLAIGGLAVSFFCAVALLLQPAAHTLKNAAESSLTWVKLPGLLLEFGILVDPWAVLMSLVVTGVGLNIFIYSVGYMKGDAGFTRYFAVLSLFAFSMLGIVLANNFVTCFIFWELVGASSYLLIGHWYDRPKAAEAGKKAFLVNRIADFGFLLGILLLWSLSGLAGETKTLNYLELAKRLEFLAASPAVNASLLALAGGLIFCGVVGKSAQFPLHVWLPDAMEGPTPVSALIHAATMVAAGVYLLSRAFFLFAASPDLMALIAWVGGATALLAAGLALVENDIKRILAYSTLSQLGFMVMALGLGGRAAGIYHLTTHAFFKALLFLGAGSVIHALHTNDIRQMGGLLKPMPVTSATFLVGTFALCGIFPLSGFFSKDEILAVAYAHDPLLWKIGTLTAGLTAFYMGRLVSIAFLGESRARHPAREAPPIMTRPLLVLAFFSAVGGFLGIPHFLMGAPNHEEMNWTVAVTSTVVSAAGLGLAFALFRLSWRPLPWLTRLARPFLTLLERKYFVDDLYAWINRNVQQRLAHLSNAFERYVIIGLWVNGTAKMTGLTGSALRLIQTGKVQAYALLFLAGLSLLTFLSLGKPWAR